MISNTKQDSKAESQTRKYLLVDINREAYGIEISRIRELRRYGGVTSIANCPPYMCGVINLRGSIVPIIDMRIRFGSEKAEYTKETEVVILELSKVDSDNKKRLAGVVVDQVNDVAKIKLEDIKPAPEVSGIFSSSYLAGLVIHGEGENDMYRLFDIDKLMNSDEMAMVEKDVTAREAQAATA